MRFRGGYDIQFHGRPGELLKEVVVPKVLYLPLHSKSFNFTAVCVSHGQQVSLGEKLAEDPDNYDAPLLSPSCGKVDLEKTPGHITLEELSSVEPKSYIYHDDSDHIHKKMGPAGIKRYKLLNLGAWEFMKEAYTGQMPDPLSTPQAVIVSTLQLEPFLVRGDVLLKEHLRQFTHRLEHLQSLLEYQPIYLAFPKVKSDFAAKIKEQIRGYAWVKLIEVPMKYPYDNFQILSRHLGLKRNQGSIWGVNVEGVLAIDNALTASRPCVERIISVAGPGASLRQHLRLMAGYPIAVIKDEHSEEHTITIDGGILTGRLLTDDTKGVPAECRGITFVPEHQSREFLGWLRPGFDRQSYSGSFLSSLCSVFPDRVTNAIRGELRPCVSCGFCEDVCPAGIMPHRLHKLIYQDDIDTVEKFRIDLCVECGLCSFVCPSKIELMHQFQDMKQTILKEKEIAAAEAAKEAAKEASESQLETE
ncbi:MAG: 4Fe-4S dicluster domain-containing protein [Planctomycetes bacterium]|nr:4Fe-4S dicluster domain-containing protein [Planctomycetota bacterium]